MPRVAIAKGPSIAPYGVHSADEPSRHVGLINGTRLHFYGGAKAGDAGEQAGRIHNVHIFNGRVCVCVRINHRRFSDRPITISRCRSNSEASDYYSVLLWPFGGTATNDGSYELLDKCDVAASLAVDDDES